MPLTNDKIIERVAKQVGSFEGIPSFLIIVIILLRIFCIHQCLNPLHLCALMILACIFLLH